MVAPISTNNAPPPTASGAADPTGLNYLLMTLLGVNMLTSQNAQLDGLIAKADLLNSQLQDQLAELKALGNIPSDEITPEELTQKIRNQNNQISMTNTEIGTVMQVDVKTAEQQIKGTQKGASKQLAFLTEQEQVLGKH